MQVLIFCPIHPERGLYKRTKSSMERLDGDVAYSQDNPFDNARDNIAHNYNLARDYVLEHDYDALLTVESDMIIPENALKLMLELEADVVYGLYPFRKGGTWNCFTRIDRKTATRLTSLDKSIQRGAWGSVIESEGMGTGCTLIHRHVLEAIPFRVVEDRLNHDWVFALDVKNEGFTQMHDLRFLCGHIDEQFHDPCVMYCDLDEGVRFEYQGWFEKAEAGDLWLTPQ